MAQIKKPVIFVEEYLTNALCVIEEVAMILNIPYSVSSSFGSNRGVEKGSVGVLFPEPMDTRSLLRRGLLLAVEVG